MESLGLSALFSLPRDGVILHHSAHNGWLVLLAFLVAMAACFTTLGITERMVHARQADSRLSWAVMGALCMGGGIWSLHFLCMLAFQSAIPIRHELAATFASLLIALITATLMMYILGRPTLPPRRYLTASLGIGLGIAAMHYSGMLSLVSVASQHYDPQLFVLSLMLAIVASLVSLLLGTHFRHRTTSRQRLLKLSASALMALAILSMHATGMLALTLVVPEGTPLQSQPTDRSIQLGLSIGLVTLMIIVISLGAAWTNRKLQGKERDLRRVNALLRKLDHAQASLQKAAHHDPLTNLLNRRGFNSLFAEKLDEHAEQGRDMAVMFLDIDHFKRINDSLGHDAGDELLQVIAQRIRSAVREGDAIARFGGDEFCILASLEQQDDARLLAQRVMQTMKEPIALAGRSMVMTTSIGISLFPEDGDVSEELLKHADMALYQSKGSGRNHFTFFSERLRSKASFELELEEDLRNALARGEGLQLFYQPIVDLRSGRATKLEALLRWQHPQHGMLAPDRFIGIAEANGFISELDDWVLRRACHDVAALRARGQPPLTVTVNCSALNLAQEQLTDDVERALRESGLPAQLLELEVTENALMGHINRAISLLRQIRQLGVSLAIDDFGTGYSSLAYLKRLPINTLKIDRSFIQDLAASEEDRQVIQAILAMAHALGLQVVAEGVESDEQLAFLREQGCDFIQGFLFCRPLPMAQLESFLEQRAQLPLPLHGQIRLV
jgi:diguanylate cyclase (GGDEF)-like protein